MKNPIIRLGPVVVAAGCAVFYLLSEAPVRAAGSQVLHGHVPAAAAGLQPLRHFDGTNHLKLAISLPLRDQAGLSNLLQEIYDPASPNYHHYLTAPQFAERFGPSAEDYQTLMDFAASNNLTVIGTHPNRTLLDVQGSISDIEKTLHVTMQVYRHPTEQRDFFAPDKDPSIDLTLPVLHISGLDNFRVPHPTLKKTEAIRPGNIKAAVGSGGSGLGGTFLGNDFRAAYAPGVALTGAGQTVGLVELDAGFDQSDITAYEQLAGTPSVPITPVLLDGYNGSDGPNNGEVCLDIEMSIAMAPGLAGVLVYEGSIGDDILNRMATDNSAQQLSASWVGYSDAASDQIYLQFAAQGQSFFNSSGDSDAYIGVIDPPADDPNITIVGGTSLTTSAPGGPWTTEQVWNLGYQPPGGNPLQSNYWGSGGGISPVWSIPVWQRGINMSSNLGSDTMRDIPDVALTADNIFITYGDGLSGDSGGTSAASPLWAGFTALVNQQAAANGDPAPGFLNPALYSIGKGSSYLSCFHDIVLGSNVWPSSSNLFFAVPGYDLCTGWGTPMGGNLINALAPLSTTPILAVATNIISGGNGNGVIDVDECNDLTLVLTNSGRFTATGIEATLTSTTYGAIVGQGVSAYPDLNPRGSAANATPFTISTEPNFICGTPINLTLVVKCDQVVQTNYLQLPTGLIGSPTTFSISPGVPIPGTGKPLNSSLFVSGLSQPLGKVTLSLFLTNLFDSSIALQLISPNGTSVILTTNNTSTNANYGAACFTGLETTFDDAASVPISAGTPPYLGTFRPQQPLAAFNLLSGTNLNGIWTLQAVNQSVSNTAVLECWSLNIAPVTCVDGGGTCPGSDLSLTMSASPNPAFVGSNVIYTLTVSNAGPSTAPNVLVVQSLPQGVVGINVLNNSVSVSQIGSNLDMTLASLPVYGSAIIPVSMTFTTNTLGTNASVFVTSTATVSSPAADPNPNNNTASAAVLVTEPTADLAVSMAASPSSVLEDGLLTYTITVTDNGPFPAEGVTLATSLPASASVISATASQGTLNLDGAFANLGAINPGANAVVTIVVSPAVPGTITASATATLGANSGELDPNIFNNTASISSTVGPAADLGISALASPNPVVSGANVGYIMTVANAGPSSASQVVVSQTLPPGSTFISSTLPGHTVSGNVVSGTLASLPSGSNMLFVNVVRTPALPPGAKSNLVSTFTVFGQPGDPNTNNNLFILTNTEEPPTETIVAAGATVTSGSANGAIGTSGTYGVQLFLQNVGNIPTTNLIATLQSGNGVTPVNGSNIFDYHVLTNGDPPVGGQFAFTANGTNGGTIQAVLQLVDGSANLGTATFTFTMPVVQTFWSTNFISIPAQRYIPNPDSGPANPYPSALVVSNVAGEISSVTVTISNLIHSYPNDIGILLVGPTANCVLMSAAADYSTLAEPITVTFDQSAPLLLPEAGEIVSGSYQPADYYESQYNQTETFTGSPVPVGPYNTNLAVFGNVSPNGTWYLYVEDDSEGDAGAISNGWSLSFTKVTPVNQVADLAVGILSSTNQLTLGNSMTTLWYVTNNGPDAVSNVFVTNILSSGLALSTNVLPPGAITLQTGQTSIYNLGVLAAGSGAIVTNIVTSTNITGPQTNTVTVASFVLDDNPVNNTASVVTTVNPPSADLIVAPISVSPNPVLLNGTLVFNLFVTNNGPGTAYGVAGSLALSGLQFISTSPNGGALNNGVVTCSLGNIQAGSNAEVEIVATAPSSGIVTNVWTVQTTSSNLNAAHNSVSATVTVIYPVPVITNGPATLMSQSSPREWGA